MNTYLVDIYEIDENKAKQSLVSVKLSEEKSSCEGLNATLNCHSISIDKRINDISTGLIRLHMSVQGKTVNDIRDFLLRKLVTVSFGEDDNKKSQVLTNFYVSDIEISADKTAQTYFVDLSICSMDNYLTFRKYSKVHTSKKLGSEIFEKEIKEQFGSLLETNHKDQRILKYSYSGKSDEYIQPYLVQYNEPFYDFLLRTANRCGEFLYFEDGKLNLGLVKSSKTNAFEGYTFLELIDEGARAETDNNEFHANCATKGKSITDPLVSDIANDEYLEVVTKGDFDSTSKEMEYLTPIDASIFGTYGKYGNLIEGTAQVAMDMTERTTSSFNYAYMDNNDFDEQYFDDIVDKNRYSNDNNKFALFTTYMDGQTADNFTHDDKFGKRFSADYYSTIAKCQDEIKKCKVVATFPKQSKDYPEYKLGEEVKLGDEKHIIYNIHLEASVEKQKWDNEIKMTLIPSIGKDDIPVAPLSQKGRIRKIAGTQMAVVTDNFDPKYLGRVRVKYTWQTDDNSSPWIKVMAGLATKKGTVYFHPQPGDYVLVDYEHENVELPFVAGSVFTKEAPPKYGTRKYENVISCPNGHTIRIASPNDTSLAMTSLVPAIGLLKGFMPTVGVLDFTDDKIARGFAGGIEITDDYNLYSISTSTDNRAVKFNSALGDIEFNAFNGVTISAPKGDLNITAKNINITARNEIKIHSGERPESLSTAILDIVATITTMGLDLLWDPTMLDLNSLRNVIEMFIRPVNGTLRISSSRYVFIEAGTGNSVMPRNAYSMTKAKEVCETKLSITATTIKMFGEAIDKALENYLTAYDKIHNSYPIIRDYLRDTYHLDLSNPKLEEVLSNAKLKDGHDNADSVAYFHEVLMKYGVDKWKITRLGIRMRSSIGDFAKRGSFTSINKRIKELLIAIRDIKVGNFAYTQDTIGNWHSIDYPIITYYEEKLDVHKKQNDNMATLDKLKVLVGKKDGEKYKTDFTTDITRLVRDAIIEDGVIDVNQNRKNPVDFDMVISIDRRKFIEGKRRLVFSLLKEFGTANYVDLEGQTFDDAEQELENNYYDDQHWHSVVNKVIPHDANEEYDTKDVPSDTNLNWDFIDFYDTLYSSPSEGQILFSDQKGKTYQLGEGKIESVEHKMFFIRNVLNKI